MNIAIIGATGFIGQHLLNEAIERGHHVTAIARNLEKLPTSSLMTKKSVDLNDSAALVQAIQNHSAVILSLHHEGLDISRLIREFKTAGVSRLLVVGGAGSLEIAPGLQLVDSPDFPDMWKATALAAREFLIHLRAEKELNWVYASPSAMISPGMRTGKFRIGGDQLLKDQNGESKISSQDFAVALLDEIETPKHIRTRFTVGY